MKSFKGEIMNRDYLYSILNLYLKKEANNKKVFLTIKKLDDNVEFNFNMKKGASDKTTFSISYDEYNECLLDFLNKYKEELLVIDEKYNYDNMNNTCYYYVLFNSGRSISFNGFSVLEMNNVRNMLYDIQINQEEIRLDTNKEKQMVYQPRLRLQQAGFSSYATLFLIVIFFADVLVIALWIFKSLLK